MGRINQNWLERRKLKPAATAAQAEQPTHALPESPAVDEQHKVVSAETPANAPLKSSAGTESQNVIFDEKPADALLKSVNDTAGNARNLFVTYILLSVYIFLTVGATNDEQLLRDDSVAVPFLENINLPVSRFYQFVPWMFLFVHADLLLLFKLMADKLHAFNETINKPEFDRKEAAELRQQLSGLPFVHWLAGDQNDSFSHIITGLIVWSSLLVLPLLTLLALQIGFLPYHSMWTTAAHRLALGLDALALLWFWPRLAAGMTEWTLLWWLPFWLIRLCKILIASRIIQSVLRIKEAVNQWIAFRVRKARHQRKQVLNADPKLAEIQQRSFLQFIEHPTACRGVCRTASLFLLLGSVWFGWFVLVLPRDRLEDDGVLVHWLLDTIDPYYLKALDIHRRLHPKSQEFEKIQSLLKNLGIDSTAQKTQDLKTRLVQLKTQAEELLEDGFHRWLRPHLPLFPRNLDLHEKVLVKNELEPAALAELLEEKLKLQDRTAKLVKIKGLDLQNRDLRFANLGEAKLWKADMRGANLEHANLSKAQLQGIQWDSRVRLQAAVLRNAGLQGADLQNVHLQGADLSNAQLQGANLQAAQLQGAVLNNAELQGANLQNSKLLVADMMKANLQTANLNSSDLRGANLSRANITGAYYWSPPSQKPTPLSRHKTKNSSDEKTEAHRLSIKQMYVHFNLVYVRLQGADLSEAKVGSTAFPDVFSLNDFRSLNTSKLLTQQDFDFWKTEIRGFIKDEREAKQREEWLQSRIGKMTDWPKEVIKAPCLSDAKHPAPFQNCQSSQAEFDKARYEYLGNLACDFLAAEEQEFIAKRLALRLFPFGYIYEEIYTYQRQLAKRLLQDDCAGKAGLDDELRAELRKIAEAPEAKVRK